MITIIPSINYNVNNSYNRNRVNFKSQPDFTTIYQELGKITEVVEKSEIKVKKNALLESAKNLVPITFVVNTLKNNVKPLNEDVADISVQQAEQLETQNCPHLYTFDTFLGQIQVTKSSIKDLSELSKAYYDAYAFIAKYGENADGASEYIEKIYSCEYKLEILKSLGSLILNDRGTVQSNTFGDITFSSSKVFDIYKDLINEYAKTKSVLAVSPDTYIKTGTTVVDGVDNNIPQSYKLDYLDYMIEILKALEPLGDNVDVKYINTQPAENSAEKIPEADMSPVKKVVISEEVKKKLSILDDNNISYKIDEDGMLILDEFLLNRGGNYSKDDLNEIFRYIKKIEGNASFSYTNLTNLGGLEYIGGDADFSCSDIQTLGKIKYMGSAYFGYKIALEHEWNSRKQTSAVNQKAVIPENIMKLAVDLFKDNNISYRQDKDGMFILDNFFIYRYKTIYSDKDYNEIFKYVKRIEGHASFFPPINNLGNLEYIGGRADFSKAQIPNLGKLKYMGSADFGDRTDLEKKWNNRKIHAPVNSEIKIVNILQTSDSEKLLSVNFDNDKVIKVESETFGEVYLNNESLQEYTKLVHNYSVYKAIAEKSQNDNELTFVECKLKGIYSQIQLISAMNTPDID